MPYTLKEAKERMFGMKDIPDFIDFYHKGRRIDLRLYKHFEYVKLCIIGANCFYEHEMLDHIHDTQSDLIKDRTIVDVGANIGNHSRYFEEFLGPRCIHAFEPAKENTILFKQNTRQPTTFLHEMALGDVNKEVSLHNPNFYNGGMWQVTEGTGIKMVKLDDFGLADVALIKIDVEGHEAEVLRGAEKTIKQYKPLIYVEPNKEETRRVLTEYGYKKTRAFEYDTVITEEWQHDKG